MGKNEEVAVMYIITDDDNQFLGYSTTRITTERWENFLHSDFRASYICAAPKTRGSKNCLGVIAAEPAEVSF